MIYIDFNSGKDVAIKDHISDASAVETDTSNPKNANSIGHNEYINPFGDSINQLELNDEDYINYIHKMSHQKVSADVKWGFYKITDDRINWLFEGLNKTKQTLSHKELYRNILIRWDEGDYSNVVNDHNELWKIQGGSIGKAKEKLNAEQEKNTKK